jgi:hypothetical protein
MNPSKADLFDTAALTQTHTPREREPVAMRFLDSSARPANPAASFRVRLVAILPLLGGEGRGEGGCSTTFGRDFYAPQSRAGFQPARANEVGAEFFNFKTLAFARSLGRLEACPTLAA